MLQAKQIKQHQVYFEKGDYEQKTAVYKRDGSARFNQQQLLLVAKGFFLDAQFAQCLRVLSIIEPLYSSKVLFQRQSLQFRADFLLKRNLMPNIEDMTAWRQMLDMVERQSTKVRGPPLQAHHFNVIKHYKDFLSLVEERLGNKIVLDNDIFKQQKQLEANSRRYEGFPIYLLAAIWVDDFNKAMSTKSETYLAPINNFSIINDVFQIFHYENTCELYKNVCVFPGASFVTISKKYWNYLNSLINYGKQGFPVKRLVSLQQSSLYDGKAKATRIQPLVPVAIQYNQQILCIQLTHNKGVEEQFYNLVERKYGLGQFKIKSGDGWSIQDIQGPTQNWFQGFNKLLYYHIVKMPKSIPLNQLRPLLKFQFQSLPVQYLKDPQNGLKGLENIGNSCYLNSCMQCLSKTQDIITFAVPNNTLQGISFDQKDGVVITAFSDLMKSLWNKQITKKSIYPRKFKRAFGQKYTQFLEKTQEDAHEFLLCLLNSLHEELKVVNSKLLRSLSKLQATTDQKRVKQYFQRHQLQQNKSIIMNIFRGKIHNTMHCRSCQALSHSYDVFLALTLPIPQKQSRFLDIFFSGWETRQTKRYRIHLQDMKTAQQIIGVLKQAIKRKTQVEYYYIFGEINKENLTFQEIALISSESIDILQVTLTEELMKKSEKAHFIIYEMKKKGQTELLALVDYRHEKNGLVLGFPKMMYVEEKQMKQSLYMFQFKREIATNDKQNFFRSFDIEGLYVTRPKQGKGKPTSNIFDYIVQVIFTAKQRIFKGTDEIYEQLNDPNTNYSIYDCFDLMRQPEVLENSWTCGNCKKSERVQKRQEISQTSSILIIHLKRFKADYRKIKAMIEYPIRSLEIDKWIQNKKESERNFRYDLYAVCLHSGTAEYGHYKAYCKHFISQKWYQFDDGTVTQIQKEKVVSPFAYMLFYKRVTQI